MLIITINTIWPYLWWIHISVHLLRFWHGVRSWFLIVNIGISKYRNIEISEYYNITISFSQNVLFWFVNPFKLGRPSARRQILWREDAWTEHIESRTFPQLFYRTEGRRNHKFCTVSNWSTSTRKALYMLTSPIICSKSWEILIKNSAVATSLLSSKWYCSCLLKTSNSVRWNI
jgi:hypothetical protein